MQEEKIEMFKLQPKLSWRQLQVEKEDRIVEFTNEEIAQYVCELYMHDGIMPMKHHIRHVCLLKMLKDGKNDV